MQTEVTNQIQEQTPVQPALPIAWPKDAKDVRDFFHADFITAQFAAADQTPCDEDRYLISAHDFLSAVNWWANFPHAPRVDQAAPLPLLIRDIARDLGITALDACQALKDLGNYSVNMAVTAEMAAKLRELFPVPQAVPAAVAVPCDALQSIRTLLRVAKNQSNKAGMAHAIGVVQGELEKIAGRAALAATPAAAPDMVSVKTVDANNYCRILAALGMEEEGDPVAEVQNLLAAAAAPVTQTEATWCEYIAGMIGCYLKEPDESPRVKAIAGIIERRLWALPSPKPMARAEKSDSFEAWAKAEGGPFALHNCGPYNRDAMKLAGMAWHASALQAGVSAPATEGAVIRWVSSGVIGARPTTHDLREAIAAAEDCQRCDCADCIKALTLPLKLVEAINTAVGGNEWQGDALVTDLLEPACKVIANLTPRAQADQKARMKIAAALGHEGVNFAWSYLTGAVKELVKAEGERLKLQPQAQTFQRRVQPWMMACFGPEISADRIERNHRFLEEALELVQSRGCTASEAHQLVDYVFARPVGDPMQEAGGVMVTLAALCLASGLDMHACGETELARIWTKVEAIRAKQAAKPKHSPLPMHAPQTRDALRLAFVLSEIRRDGMDALGAALHDADGFPLDHKASLEAIDRASNAAASGK